MKTAILIILILLAVLIGFLTGLYLADVIEISKGSATSVIIAVCTSTMVVLSIMGILRLKSD